MYARIATFESDPGNVDDAIGMVRAEVVPSASTRYPVARANSRLAGSAGLGHLHDRFSGGGRVARNASTS